MPSHGWKRETTSYSTVNGITQISVETSVRKSCGGNNDRGHVVHLIRSLLTCIEKEKRVVGIRKRMKRPLSLTTAGNRPDRAGYFQYFFSPNFLGFFENFCHRYEVFLWLDIDDDQWFGNQASFKKGSLWVARLLRSCQNDTIYCCTYKWTERHVMPRTVVRSPDGLKLKQRENRTEL